MATNYKNYFIKDGLALSVLEKEKEFNGAGREIHVRMIFLIFGEKYEL
jgi:hypothetical protein